METEKMENRLENRMENRMDFLATSTFSDSDGGPAAMLRLIPGEARLSEKCSLYRILEHVDDSVRPSVCLSVRLHGDIKTAAR